MVDLGEVRRMVIAELMAAGFELRGGLLAPPVGDDKDVVRALHATQRRQALHKASDFIAKWEDQLLPSFADGPEVQPDRIDPVVTPVVTEEEGALFRFAALHWAVPVSQGYGRRTRFLIRDRSNDRLIGIFALGDPVFNLRVRDELIGWGQQQRQNRLYNVFDAFVLGAVDPYRQLIGGKLAALCAVSNETRRFLEDKYEGTTTVISGEKKTPVPVLITTTSALGRSSIYNRIRMGDRKVFRAIGFTEGFGHFQFSDDLFAELVELVSIEGNLRGNSYGDGPNWKMRTIRRALEKLGLSGDLLKHGIRREVFIAPLSLGWRAFLRGETAVIKPISYPLEDIASHFRTRWAIPRAERRPEYRDWSRESMRLSTQLPRRKTRLAAPLF
jgi:hypothetical protein